MEPARKRVLLASLVSLVYAMEARRAKTSNRKRDKARCFLEGLFNSQQVPGDLLAEEQPAAGADEDPVAKAQELGYEVLTLSCFAQPALGNTKKFWYCVFLKKGCKWPGAPTAVVAVRGTRFSLRDMVADLEVLAQSLHLDKRGPKLRKVVDTVVGIVGSWSNVCIAGHSLGAALSLLVAKDLARENRPIEAHLFNPPFASFAFMDSELLRDVERGVKALMLVTAMASVASDSDTVQRLVRIHRDFWSLEGWSPHLYLHPRDVICKGYLNFFKDHGRLMNMNMNASLAGSLQKLVVPHSLLGIVSKNCSAKHLIPSAVLVVATDKEGGDPHCLRQWQDIDKDVRLQHIQVPLVAKIVPRIKPGPSAA